VDCITFDEIFDTISPYLDERNSRYAINSFGSSISNKTRLVITLQWLVDGSYVDLCFAWGIVVSTFFSDRGVHGL
jgi:hypothetical protein